MIEVSKIILEDCKADKIIRSDSIQSLWSGYGEIKRYFLKGAKYDSVIVKHISIGTAGAAHPRGWNTDISHQRKLKSYEVERYWYEHYAQQCSNESQVPQLIASHANEAEMLLIMEDLDALGFDKRRNPNTIQLEEMKSCLKWLAHFHAKFMGSKGEGLWEIGTYWYLDTRPDEYDKMKNESLKAAAGAIDKALNTAKYKTLVHGDAKLANFCFSAKGSVAAVDFQYVGGGCGMKDVAYFISSCLEEEEIKKYEKALLDFYYQELQSNISSNIDFQELKKEWERLYLFAWADFYRFLEGWTDVHWKKNQFIEARSNKVIRMIGELRSETE